MTHGLKMPVDKKVNMENQVKQFLEINSMYLEKIEGDYIRYLADENNLNLVLNMHGEIDWKKESGNVHGIKVVEKLENLQDFIKR